MVENDSNSLENGKGDLKNNLDNSKNMNTKQNIDKIVNNLENGTTIEENVIKEDSPSSFDDAISATGFGKFNYLLIFCSLPAFCTNIYVSSTLSYIMSNAECDLNMTLADMGRLNTFTYAGMICSALLWGFLSDTLGRKRIMVYGFLSLTIMEFIASQSTTYLMLALAKFFAGCIVNGPFAVFLSYVSELHKSSIRASVLVFLGVFFPFATTSIPLIAWATIQRNVTLSLFGGAYTLHSWQVFLSLFSIPPLLTGLIIMILPESPKFLMSRGRNDEAIKIFQRIYTMNTGKSASEFPIKTLVEERGDSSTAPEGWKAIKGGFKQLKPLFMPPYVLKLSLVCYIMASTMYGGNTLRLWFPQISTIIEDYNSKHTEPSRFCNMIDSYVLERVNDTVNEVTKECVKIDSGVETYINSMIIGAAGFVSALGLGFVVKVIKKRLLACLVLIIAGCCAGGLYWSSTFPEIVALFAIFVSVNAASTTLVSSIAVDLFPTSMRAMAIALTLMFGRLGTVTGGLVFPYLLELGCYVPFLVICCILLVSGILCTLVPKTADEKKKKMEKKEKI